MCTRACIVFLILFIQQATAESRVWLAGDHHIHSRFSVGWDESAPPKPIIGGDAIYPIPTNAEMARKFGLSWMVATDHGGPNHSKVNLEQAYPELLHSRTEVPEVIQFFGLELNTPGADHSSIIVPHSHDEAEHLHAYESRFDAREAWPLDEARDQEPRMLEALKFADQMEKKPVVIAHHPSRSASESGVYGKTTPAELRAWNDTAPEVAVGMEGAPGHQAASIRVPKADEFQYPDWVYARGAYGRGYPTMGGFDQMTAIVGGFWDSMLGEGRRWWITANSDSHIHYTEGGIDFWPGEYSKTYVYAGKSADDILDGLRNGRVFVVTGDLIDELYLEVSSESEVANMGGELTVKPGDEITITVKVRDPGEPNVSNKQSEVSRVDLIAGSLTGRSEDQTRDKNETTHVVKRFTASQWSEDQNVLTMQHKMVVDGPMYVRIRGTNTQQAEPEPDRGREDPWTDLWFYSNPVFVSTRER